MEGGRGSRPESSRTDVVEVGSEAMTASDAEMAVLASMLLDARAIPRARALLCEQDFNLDRHRHTFAAACALHDRGEPADLVTVSEELRRSGDLAAVGGAGFLSHIFESATTATNLGWHAAVVLVAASRRRLRRLGLWLMDEAEDPTTDLDAMLAHLRRESAAASVLHARAEMARHACP
jgi:replicative DNA helicase